MYRKMKQPIASSRCYEQLGNFNKAIEVLYESDNYDLAIDALRRYNMHVNVSDVTVSMTFYCIRSLVSCFQCNITILNFFILHLCIITWHYVM